MNKTFYAGTAIVWMVVLTIYLTIAAMSGGQTKLIENTFGGTWEAITMITFVALIVAALAFFFWLARGDHTSEASLGWSIVAVVIMIAAAIVGFAWVNWSFSPMWILLLFAPFGVGIWLTGVVARRSLNPAKQPKAKQQPANQLANRYA